jgi:carotenoid cleavage dioxygenase-like enzyme
LINYYVADKDGKLTVRTKVPLKRPIMMHDFAVTKTRSLILDNPIVFSIPGIDPKANPAKNPILSFMKDNGSRIAVIPRHFDETKDKIQWIDIETCSVIHTAGAYDLPEENNRYIAFIAPRSTQVELRALSGRGVTAPEMARLHMYLIDTQTGTAVERNLDADLASEFPVINPKYAAKPMRYIYAGTFAPEDPRKFNGVVKYDLGEGYGTLAGMKSLVEGKREVGKKVFEYGGKRYSGEAVFAPRYPNANTAMDPATGKPLAEDDGFLICFVHDEGQGPNAYDGNSELLVFLARQLLIFEWSDIFERAAGFWTQGT